MSPLRDLQCPQCRAWFRTANVSRRYCDDRCREKHKAENRPPRATVRDFRPEYQDQHRRESGAASTRRALTGDRVVDWPAVIDRFKADMKQRYEGEDE